MQRNTSFSSRLYSLLQISLKVSSFKENISASATLICRVYIQRDTAQSSLLRIRRIVVCNYPVSTLLYRVNLHRNKSLSFLFYLLLEIFLKMNRFRGIISPSSLLIYRVYTQ